MSYPQVKFVWRGIILNMLKIIIIFILVLLLVGAGAYYFGYQLGYGKGMKVGRAAAQTGAEAAVTNPLENLPETNPFEKAVNPFKDLYQNPFK